MSGAAAVVDGDTLRLAGVRVRLWGVDAPEVGRPFADVARRELRALVARQTVRCEPLDVDTYGRTVAECWVGTANLGVNLVSQGLAVGWPQFLAAHPERAAAYVTAEADARRRRAGLWAQLPR